MPDPHVYIVGDTVRFNDPRGSYGEVTSIDDRDGGRVYELEEVMDRRLGDVEKQWRDAETVTAK